MPSSRPSVCRRRPICLAVFWTSKSSRPPRAGRWRTRTSRATASLASSMAAASTALTKIALIDDRLKTRRMAVAIGITSSPSSSPPSAAPFGASVPITWNGTPRSRSSRPTASPSGKSASAIRAPSTATRRASASSASSRNRPAWTR